MASRPATMPTPSEMSATMSFVRALSTSSSLQFGLHFWRSSTSLLPDKPKPARGLVKAFRYGLVMQGGSRVVLDTTGPVRVDKVFALPCST